MSESEGLIKHKIAKPKKKKTDREGRDARDGLDQPHFAVIHSSLNPKSDDYQPHSDVFCNTEAIFPGVGNKVFFVVVTFSRVNRTCLAE
jgi:hypothetical protein